MQETLLTEWQLYFFLYLKSRVALIGVSISCKQREKARVLHTSKGTFNIL